MGRHPGERAQRGVQPLAAPAGACEQETWRVVGARWIDFATHGESLRPVSGSEPREIYAVGDPVQSLVRQLEARRQLAFDQRRDALHVEIGVGEDPLFEPQLCGVSRRCPPVPRAARAIAAAHVVRVAALAGVEHIRARHAAPGVREIDAPLATPIGEPGCGASGAAQDARGLPQGRDGEFHDGDLLRALGAPRDDGDRIARLREGVRGEPRGVLESASRGLEAFDDQRDPQADDPHRRPLSAAPASAQAMPCRPSKKWRSALRPRHRCDMVSECIPGPTNAASRDAPEPCSTGGVSPSAACLTA